MRSPKRLRHDPGQPERRDRQLGRSARIVGGRRQRSRSHRRGSQEVSTGTFSAMASRFDGAAGAFAYLLFILLYFPCTAAIAVVYQESGARWTIFVAGWTTGLAYGLAATIYYQVATYASHPASSMGWDRRWSVAFAGFFFILRTTASRRSEPLRRCRKNPEVTNHDPCTNRTVHARPPPFGADRYGPQPGRGARRPAGMLGILERKGRVRRLPTGTACGGGCNKCHPKRWSCTSGWGGSHSAMGKWGPLFGAGPSIPPASFFQGETRTTGPVKARSRAHTMKHRPHTSR
jgi:hypothetical protein